MEKKNTKKIKKKDGLERNLRREKNVKKIPSSELWIPFSLCLRLRLCFLISTRDRNRGEQKQREKNNNREYEEEEEEETESPL